MTPKVRRAALRGGRDGSQRWGGGPRRSGGKWCNGRKLRGGRGAIDCGLGQDGLKRGFRARTGPARERERAEKVGQRQDGNEEYQARESGIMRVMEYIR
jgi:hypothetical protein